MSVNAKECRICFEDVVWRRNYICCFWKDELIRPCRCKGSAMWIHRSCLKNKRQISDKSEQKCTECNSAFWIGQPNAMHKLLVFGTALRRSVFDTIVIMGSLVIPLTLVCILAAPLLLSIIRFYFQTYEEFIPLDILSRIDIRAVFWIIHWILAVSVEIIFSEQLVSTTLKAWCVGILIQSLHYAIFWYSGYAIKGLTIPVIRWTCKGVKCVSMFFDRYYIEADYAWRFWEPVRDFSILPYPAQPCQHHHK